MGVAKLCVIFDKPDRVYYPGEMVTGRVQLVLHSAMKIRGVELKMKGKAKNHWKVLKSESFLFSTHYKIVSRKSTEIYINSKQILFEKKDFQLPAGEHTYTFSAMLPLKAPSSFSGPYGEISYYGRAKIDISSALDKKERTTFTVISPLDLNLYPNLRTKFEDERSKTFYCLWCASGSLTLTVRLPRGGFAATESIPLTVEIDNASNETVLSKSKSVKI